MKAGGIMSEQDYPYEGRDAKCRFDPTKIAASITNYTFVAKDAKQMQAYVFKNGPIAIAADATVWQFYYSGIWYLPCGTNINHAILLVGWGHQKDMYANSFFEIQSTSRTLSSTR